MSLCQAVRVWPEWASVGNSRQQGLPTGQSARPNDLETLPSSEAGFWWLGHVHSQEYKDSKEPYLHLRCVAHTF